MGYHEMVEDLAKGHLGACEVVRVAVHEDHSWDGHLFVDVTVIWDDAVSRLDVDKAADFKRTLRAAFDEVDGAPFPVVSFTAKSEESEAA